MNLLTASKTASVVILGSLFLSGCIPGFGTDTTTNTTDTGSDSTTQSELSQRIEATEMVALLAAGQAVHCVIDNPTQQESIDMYQKGEQMRLVTSRNGALTGGMIKSGEYVHSWNETDKTGVRMRLTESELAGIQSDTDFTVSSEEDVQDLQNQGYTFNCSKADVTADTFTPPVDVTFQDLSALMGGN